MGKREVRVIVVPKRATVVMLLLTTAVMAASVWFLSGRAYANPAHATAELMARLVHAGTMPRDAVIAVVMPLAANALAFIPWGFLMFLAVDRPERPRSRAYAITVIAGVIFATAIELWQYVLPTRVTTLSDAIANGAGALAGAALGHMRKRVRVRFET